MKKKNEKWLWILAVFSSLFKLDLIISLILLNSNKKDRQELIEERKPLLLLLLFLLLPFIVLFIVSFFLPIDLRSFWEVFVN